MREASSKLASISAVVSLGATAIVGLASSPSVSAAPSATSATTATSARAAAATSANASLRAVKRKRATVSVKATRTSSKRVRVKVKTNAKRSVVRAYNSTGKRIAFTTLRHRSSKKWVKVTLAKSANPARRVTVTTKKIKLNKKLLLLAKKMTTSIRKASSSTSASAYATAILAQVNSARSVARKCGGKNYPAAKKLSLDSKLNLASQRHSNDMAKRDYFDHVSPSGKTHADRATAAGYRWAQISENIAAGQTTASAAMKAWLSSPGHCENIMSKTYAHLGVGVASNSAVSYKIYWTQMFGKPR